MTLSRARGQKRITGKSPVTDEARAETLNNKKRKEDLKMTIYTVWTKSEYEPEMLAIFSNEEAANEYADRHNGRVFRDIAFATADEADAFEGFED